MTLIFTLGELLIDFVPLESGISPGDLPAFLPAPGGAPANVAVGLARLDVQSAFIGKVGQDFFGRFLAETLKREGVNITGLKTTPRAPTSLAFVTLQADGEREFTFYRQPGADSLLEPQDIDTSLFLGSRGLHYGSISLAAEPARQATLHAAHSAHRAGLFLSYDPNLRLALWNSPRSARDGIKLGWSKAHIIKISDEELSFLTHGERFEPGDPDLVRHARALWSEELRLLLVTHGKKGCTYITAEEDGVVPGFAVKTIDTTGAGDAFTAAFLARLMEVVDLPFPGTDLPGEALFDCCRFANAAGALSTRSKGAIPSFPDREEVERFLHLHPISPHDLPAGKGVN